MKDKGLLRIILCILIIMLLTSCWNRRELNELAIVTGIGIDKAPDKEEYEVTFQIVNPSSTATSTGANTGQSTTTVYSTTDRTLFGAFRKTSKKTARQLFFAHTQLVVIGEAFARSGINEIFDVFERSHELRLNSTVLVSRGVDANAVLKILLPIESLPAIGMVKKAKNTAKIWGENKNINIFELINEITGEGEVAISGIRIIGDREEGKKKASLEQTEVKAILSINGLGVFKKGKLTAWLEGSEAKGTLWVQNKIDQTIVNIDTENMEASVAVHINYSKTDINVELQGGIPVFHVHIQEEGKVNETRGFVDFSSADEIMKLEEQLAEHTKEEVIQSIQAAQRLKSDIFGFGNELKRLRPKEWEAVKEQWDSLFAQGKLDIRVEAYIRGTGMRLKPYMNKDQFN
ncbi:Ger(x)C family spore germination protein [Paenibacillus polymyxa]|uniref:Ger(x)C family spore germination protein n=1 Tax=Paenibacillus polymyxa TaxID=1406 RepID=UPI000F8860BA|nr:Ger(x)C family spore germination protein [Paenibacillus polymyxa]QDA29260.1 Ger(x)C family spore germination protein [Paenibacillus polymyxa]RTZ31580.1 Ger(x)C family spore germination protein [Paenibacillus polymyxa]WDZ57183.1 Ger(x)C family spore germination protein [Paenibacillus polymyxa]